MRDTHAFLVIVSGLWAVVVGAALYADLPFAHVMPTLVGLAVLLLTLFFGFGALAEALAAGRRPWWCWPLVASFVLIAFPWGLLVIEDFVDPKKAKAAQPIIQ